MKMTNEDLGKIRFMQNLSKDEYSLFCTYYRFEDVQEVVRRNHQLSTKDMPKPIKVTGIDFILFTTKSMGVLVEFVCIENNGTFELHEMSLKAYNEYERYMRELI